jgi:hypothetical protein
MEKMVPPFPFTIAGDEKEARNLAYIYTNPNDSIY